MHSELAGRRIFITGISRGIGFATARLFLTEGASVFGVARDEARLTGARAALASAALTPDHFDAFPLELADADAPARAADQIAERWGALDALVDNAATMPARPRRP